MRFQGFGIPFRSPRLPPGGKIWAPGGLVGENLAPRRSGELDRASGRPRGRPRGASCQIPRGKKWIWPEREHKFGRPVRQEVCKRAGAGGGLPGPSKRTPDRFSDSFSRPLNLSTPHDTPLTPLHLSQRSSQAVVAARRLASQDPGRI